MKKIFINFIGYLCVIVFLLVPYHVAKAEEVKKSQTEIGIELEMYTKEEGNIKPPLINGGNNSGNNKLLPKTGELLSSVIAVLAGISLLIFSVGVLSIKQIYQTASWEV